MAPGGKRKRGDRTFSQDSNNDGTNRPSPHRPTNLNLAQQNQQNNSRGGRRSSRGRGGASSPQSPVAPTPNAASAALKTSPTTNSAMSPPPPVGTAQRSLQTINTHTSSSNSKDRPAISPSTPQLPPTISSGYVYEYLTDDKISAWKTTGRKSVMDAAIQSRGNDGYVTLSMIFQELIHAGMEGRIGAVDAGISVKDILANLGPDLEIDASSTFLDTLSILTDSDSYNPTLRQIVFSTGIAATKMREELDAPLLMNLGLVRSSFVRMGTRKATNMLYRQSNYNLLREETEGYSKLMTEYFTSCYCGGYPPTDAPITTNEKVKALIGAFDLDVGRVLDVTLDVFASLLTANFRFFVKFLYTSPWWPESHPFSGLSYTDFGLSPLPSWAHPTSTSWFISDDEKLQLIALREERDCDFWQRVRDVGLRAFFELGGRRIMENQQELLGDPSVAAENKEDQEWISATKTLPPPGNNVAAQLLGFKLRFYTSSARGPRDTLPENLIYLIALLIKIGFISLRDIYPHVHPLDKDMPAHREKLLKEQEERDRKNRPGAANNALANAGALIDDTLPAPSRNRDIEASKTTSKVDPTTEKTGESAEETKKPDIPLPEPVDQKIRLLKSLLLMGALPEALYILGKFPWLMDVYPDLSKHVHRLLHHSLNKVYTRTRPLINRNTIRALVRPAFEQSGLSKGHLGSGDPWSRKVRSHPQIETEELRYYWDEWADTVPICQTVDDVFLLCGTLLNVSGHKIGEDPELMLKLARIGKYSVTEDPSENNRSRWKDLLKRLLVPALSLTKSNPCVVNEVFELLNTYPIMDRYNIYAEWFTGQTSRLADIKRAFEQTKAETKDVLKRISKTNVKPMARALAKVAYSSPGIVFSVALSQIESYDNLIEVVVECARYFTFLAYDVLVWSLVNSLGAQGRNRVQADGMLTSPWLRSLSLFAGKAFKRYKTMNVTPLLRYVGHQLLLGNSVDLEILEQIVTFMTGVRSELAMNDSQIYTMASGEMLQAQTLQALADERHLSGMKSSAKRLMESLSANNLSAQLLILIAQERQQYIFRDQWKDAPLKVVGNNFDKIHQVLYQYLDMLRYLLTPKDFDATVPDLISLISEFGIDPAIAWSIVRPSLSYAIKIMDTASKADEQVNGDVEMGDDSVKSPVGNPKKLEVSSGSKVETSIDLDKEDEQMTDVANIADGGPVSTPTLPSLQTIADDPWHPVLKGLIERLKDILPEGFETTMSLPFYVTFWQLSLHDMTVGKSGYEDELTRIKKGLDFPTNRSDASNRQKVLKKEDLLAKIQAEMKAQIYSFQLVKHRLLREKEHWFASFKSPKEAQAVYAAILQECFFPRILLSAMDAVYTYKLLFWLHNHGTPNFVTMHFIDGMLKEKQLTAMLFTCTARESEHFGMFLNELFKHLARWHAEKKVYEKEAHGVKKELPGFARKLTQGHNPESHMVFEDFRRLLYKWHSGMYRALKACFTGGEYMHIRNAITALKAMSATYPVVNWMGNGLTESIVLLSQTERRQDLKLSATSVLGDLKKREKNWVLPQAFHLSDAAQVRSASRSGSARPSTPQPTSDTAKALNAKAAEFKPKTNISNGVVKSSTSRQEVEDGEIDDAQVKKTKEAALTAPSSTQAQQTNVQAKTQPPSTPVPSAAAHSQRLPPQPAKVDSRTTSAGNSSVPQSLPPRPDVNRSTPSNHSAPNRAPHALPPRLDQHPPRRQQDRPSDRDHISNHRPDSGRGVPAQDYGRLDRPGEIMRDNFQDRREPSPGRRPRGRTPERGPPADRDRRDQGWNSGRDTRGYPDERNMRPLQRDAREPRANERNSTWSDSPRDRVGPSAQGSHTLPPHQDNRGRMHASTAGTTSNANSQVHPDRAPTINPDRAALIQGPERGTMALPQHDRLPPHVDRGAVNPERATLIESETGRRPDGRSERDGRRDRGSRQHSPRRGDERAPSSSFPPRNDGARDDRRDERVGPERGPNHSFPPRDRRDEPGANAPTGPRHGRAENFDSAGPARSRELFQPSQAPQRPPIDPNHGRLTQPEYALPPRPSQDPNYGRLNQGSDIPSGPRSRSSATRGGRNFTAPVQQGNSRMNEPSSQGPPPASPTDRQPPSGPLMDRRSDHRTGGQGEHSRQQNTSAPPTPSSELPPSDLVGMHPSRMNQFTSLPPPPPPLRTDVNGGQTNPSPASANFPPSGPRGGQRGPAHTNNLSGPSPTSRNPPTGPASSADRRPEDKRFAGLQGVLQQNGPSTDRGTSVRGRGRGTNPSQSPAVSQPSTPVMGRPDGLPSRPDGRSDLISGRMPGFDPGQGEPHSEGRGNRRERGRDGGSSARRHRSSRSMSPRPERELSGRRERDAPAPGSGMRPPQQQQHDDQGLQVHGQQQQQRGDKRNFSEGQGGRERRPRDDGRDARDKEPRERRDVRGDDGRPPRRGGPPQTMHQGDDEQNWGEMRQEGRNGERGQRAQREDREGRPQRGAREERERGGGGAGRGDGGQAQGQGRDGRKRGRGDEGWSESKRPRRTG